MISLDLESGSLKIIERDADVYALYDLAEKHVTIDLYVDHLPQNLAQFYHHNLSLSSSDEEVTSKKKEHEIKKKDAGSMFVDELVSWVEDEANSPYFRAPLIKSRPLRKDFNGQDNLVPRSCDLENKGMNDVAKILEGMNDGVECKNQAVEGVKDGVEGMNDAVRVGTLLHKRP
ncbi:hypothetical protein Tco_1442212 [Tanacetum coccineum]